MLFSYYLLTVCLIIIVLVWIMYKQGTLPILHRSRYPPGPYLSLPLIGDLPILFNIQPHIAFTKLSQTYGPVFSLKLGSWRTVVVNGQEAIKEALCKKFLSFAGRPPFPTWLAGSLGGKGIIVGNYCASWRHKRNTLLTTMREYISNSAHIDQIFEEECTNIVNTFKSNENLPFDPDNILTLAACNVITDYTIGRRFQPSDKNFCTLIQCTQDSLTNKHPLEGLIDFIPWISYFRSDVLQRTEKTTRRALDALKDILQENGAHDGNNNNNFTDTSLGETKRVVAVESDTISEETLVILFNLFSAGCETTVTTLRWALAFLVNHPEYQNEAQIELDRVIGSSRLPNYSDKPQLPFTYAILLEVLRRGNTAPLTVPHYTTEDATLCGYEVKKDTLVFINLYSIHMDPKLWDEPEVFNPRRFLDCEGKINCRSSILIPFSTGARTCPGDMLARRELFVF